MSVKGAAAPLKGTGLAHWMGRVSALCRQAGSDMGEETVHDLRVAIRRCRSLASGLRKMDPDRRWDEMDRAGKRVFRRLGALRDAHVMANWVRKLLPEGDAARDLMLDALAERERALLGEAREELRWMDVEAWRRLATDLPRRTARLPLDGPAFEHLALERLAAARALHRAALRNRSGAGWHALRIGLKRFRYTVENFLPGRHESWGADLKLLQDLLGEVHDLDVLKAALRGAATLFGAEARDRWMDRIGAEREARISQYRGKAVGPGSVWRRWRAGLPSGPELEKAAVARLAAWASSLDGGFSHTLHVTDMALQLYDGLCRARVRGPFSRACGRRILRLAGLIQNVGHAKGRRGHHKRSLRMIEAMGSLMGLEPADLSMAGLTARYHRGATPNRRQKRFRALSAGRRGLVCGLAGILRLASVLDLGRDGKVRRLEVESSPETIVIRAFGAARGQDLAPLLAAERYLLESACERPVVVKFEEA